jgi:hypothetical protein
MSGMQHVSADCSTPEGCAEDINALLERGGDVDELLRNDGGNQYMVTFGANWGKLEEAHKVALKTLMKVDGQWMTEDTMGESFKRVYQHTFGSDGSPVVDGECDLIQKLVDGFWGNIERVCSAGTLNEERCTSELNKVTESYYLAVGFKNSRVDLLHKLQAGSRFPDVNVDDWQNFGGSESDVCARKQIVDDFHHNSHQARMMRDIHHPDWSVIEFTQVAIAHALSPQQKGEILGLIRSDSQHFLDNRAEWIPRIYWDDEIRAAILATPKFVKIANIVSILDRIPAKALFVLFRSDWGKEDLKVLLSHRTMDCHAIQTIVRMYISEKETKEVTPVVQRISKQPDECGDAGRINRAASGSATTRIASMWESCRDKDPASEECVAMKRMIESTEVFYDIVHSGAESTREIEEKLFHGPRLMFGAPIEDDDTSESASDPLPDDQVAKLFSQLDAIQGSGKQDLANGASLSAVESEVGKKKKNKRATPEAVEKPKLKKTVHEEASPVQNHLDRLTQDQLYALVDSVDSASASRSSGRNPYRMNRKELTRWLSEHVSEQEIWSAPVISGTKPSAWVDTTDLFPDAREFIIKMATKAQLEELSRIFAIQSKVSFAKDEHKLRSALSRVNTLKLIVSDVRKMMESKSPSSPDVMTTAGWIDQPPADVGVWEVQGGKRRGRSVNAIQLEEVIPEAGTERVSELGAESVARLRAQPPTKGDQLLSDGDANGPVDEENDFSQERAPMAIEDRNAIQGSGIGEVAGASLGYRVNVSSNKKGGKPKAKEPAVELSYKDLISRLSQEELYRVIDALYAMDGELPIALKDIHLKGRRKIIDLLAKHESRTRSVVDRVIVGGLTSVAASRESVDRSETPPQMTDHIWKERLYILYRATDADIRDIAADLLRSRVVVDGIKNRIRELEKEADKVGKFRNYISKVSVLSKISSIVMARMIPPSHVVDHVEAIDVAEDTDTENFIVPRNKKIRRQQKAMTPPSTSSTSVASPTVINSPVHHAAVNPQWMTIKDGKPVPVEFATEEDRGDVLSMMTPPLAKPATAEKPITKPKEDKRADVKAEKARAREVKRLRKQEAADRAAREDRKEREEHAFLDQVLADMRQNEQPVAVTGKKPRNNKSSNK